MTLIVEDGSGLSNAESYISIDEARLYAAKYNKTWFPDSDEQGEAACRVATAYLDSLYRFVYQGTVAHANQQALEWPRSGVYYSNNTVASDKLPKFLKDATCEAAIRELAKPGSLMPDSNRGANITNITADSVSVTYGGAGLAQGIKSFPQIVACLSPLLMPNNPLCGSAGRG